MFYEDLLNIIYKSNFYLGHNVDYGVFCKNFKKT